MDLSPKAPRPRTDARRNATFGDQPFVWEVLDAAAGEYVVGFVVEDLDGNELERFVQVTVE